MVRIQHDRVFIHGGFWEAQVDLTLETRNQEHIQELEALMAQLGIAVSAPRKATGWLVEKLSELKLRLDDAGDGALRRLEALETISLGIAGKEALWHALAAAAAEAPELGGLDYARLARRAAKQRAVVESLRLRAAQEAFGSRS